VSRISILVATTSPDIKAEVIAASVAERPDMTLLEDRVLPASDIEGILKSLSRSSRCALVLVGRSVETNELAQRFLVQQVDLVVLQVDVVGDIVRIGLRDPRLETLLNGLRDMVDGVGTRSLERIARVQLETDRPTIVGRAAAIEISVQRPLLQAAIHWVHAVLRDAVERVSEENGDAHGFSLTRATLLQLLDASPGHLRADDATNIALDHSLATAETTAEPLAAVARVFELGPLEFKLMVLALAPEFDVRYQRCIGFLLDDMSRRTGTMGLYCGLLGAAPHVRAELAQRGALWRWLAFESRAIGADEPLRLDPFLAQWILGESVALASDSRVRRAMRLLPWPGAGVLDRSEEHASAAGLLEKLRGSNEARWVVLGGDDPAGWRALLELGARNGKIAPIRVDPTRLAGVDTIDVEDCATRIGRMARLTGDPLVIDVSNIDGADEIGDRVDHFLATLDGTGCRAVVICRDYARIVRQLGSAAFDIVNTRPLSPAARVAAVRMAARGAGAYLTDEAANVISNRYPLTVDGLEHAMRLAASRPTDSEHDVDLVRRFDVACREQAVEGLSNLAERIEPVFRVDDVVLPLDRKRQLAEIVDHVRLAPKVLDGWKFGDQLPYGRGVTALFFGPSGTGKTMAAMGVARTLGIQLLRIDLSRVVSKYIGDTEKNIDRVFNDAQRSGSAILIDEADALLGKRSEVKDAHDRYANIEVAYVLQRMEAYEGLAILTSNMRQNLDAAFLRRLRFIVDFPRPDVGAREQIWRFCLPEESHDLDHAAFRQLARKIELTGGHIRQITLRAAFIAAAADVRINLEHIADAARAEFAKLGMPPIEIDLNVGRRAA
jgi:AAA+ superfamily predicted ATPase